MLIGLSVLFASFSFILFRFPPSTWRALLPQASPDGRRPRARNDEPTSSDHDSSRPQPDADSKEEPQAPESAESTPKAEPTGRSDPVPSFSLSPAIQEPDDKELMPPPPSFPAPNSIQRAGRPSTGGRPQTSSPSFPSPGRSTSSNLMAPPPRPQPSQLPRTGPRPPTLAAPTGGLSDSRRMPTTGPLPHRGPVAANSTLAPPVMGGVGRLPPGGSNSSNSTPKAKSRQVELAPGHSPLDWARRQRSGENLAGVPQLLRVKPSLLKRQNGRRGRPAWSTFQGKVYNLSPYMPFHPGGVGELMRGAGRDGEKLFMEIHPWVNWDNLLDGCIVGILVGENDAGADEVSELDGLD
jgi:cytochrome b involved in lipid metabolism